MSNRVSANDEALLITSTDGSVGEVDLSLVTAPLEPGEERPESTGEDEDSYELKVCPNLKEPLCV